VPGPLGAWLIVADLLLVVIWVVRTLSLPRRDDEGDGGIHVRLPPPRNVRVRRTATFYLAFLVVAGVLIGLHPRLGQIYSHAVISLAGLALRQPSELSGYRLQPIHDLPVLIAGDILCFALVVRASLARRFVIAAHAGLYLLVAVSLDALLVVAGQSFHAPIGPYSLLALAVNLVAGIFVTTRMIFTTFMLPRATTVPRTRPAYPQDTLTVIVLILCVSAIGGAVVAFLAQPTVARSSLPILFAFSAYPLFFFFLYLLLIVVGLFRRPPPVGSARPPIDVITPSYNEAAGIARTLLSIDAAAALYQGPVRVILCDDGSTDRTAEIVRETFARFQAAAGSLVRGSHRGKSAALNTALQATTAEIVIRVDADVTLHPRALLQVPRWFRDPAVGTVGALYLPDPAGTSWIHHMRLFECLFTYGFARLGQSTVDAVNCIPGVFTAMRRDPVLAIGGFVMGMNGEDADLTMQLGRLGYRAISDPSIMVYEDVPSTVRDLREQRTRWYRAGTQVFARHSPFEAGLVGPRLWFTFSRIFSVRYTAVARPVIFLYGAQLAVLAPTPEHTIVIVLVAYLVSALPLFVVSAVLAARYHVFSQVGWLVLWYPFVWLRRVFVLEALLSLPTRPVRLRWWSA